jgi:hypothetical protein
MTHNELGRMWNRAVVALSRYKGSICMRFEPRPMRPAFGFMFRTVFLTPFPFILNEDPHRDCSYLWPLTLITADSAESAQTRTDQTVTLSDTRSVGLNHRLFYSLQYPVLLPSLMSVTLLVQVHTILIGILVIHLTNSSFHLTCILVT